LAETPSASPSSAKIIAVVVVIVAFFAGLLVGVAGDRFYLIRTRQFFPHRAMQFASRRIVDHLDRSLHLAAQQKIEIQGIIDRHRARMESIMSGIRPQMRQEIDTANGEIEKVLTPDQRAQFAKMRMHMGPRRGFGPPGPR
jgi:hypothetical protein